MNNFGDKVNFIWSIADLIRDTFKRGKYQDAILPLTVLRCIDCVLNPTNSHILRIAAVLRNQENN
jgi:type I restriction enzyme M protein